MHLEDFERAPRDIVNDEGDVLPSDGPDNLGYTAEPNLSDHHFSTGELEIATDPVGANSDAKAHESETAQKRVEKMAHALAVHGFPPKSYAELHYLSEYDLHGSGAEMMEVILSHQANLQSEKRDTRITERTERAILRDLRTYSDDSAHATSFLKLFDNFLDNYDFDQEQNVADLPMMRDNEWAHEGWMYRAIVEIRSLLDGIKLAEGKAGTLPKVEDYFKHDKAVIDALNEIPKSMTIRQMKELIAQGVSFHQARSKFWKTVVEDIELYEMGKYSTENVVRAAKDVIDAPLSSENH